MKKDIVLHLVTTNIISDSLTKITGAQSIMLIGEAIYLLASLPQAWERSSIYALKDDILARGANLSGLEGKCTLLDSPQLVNLIAQHNKICSW